MRICKTNVMLFKMLTILFVKGFKSSFKFLLRILCSIRKTQPTSSATKPLLNRIMETKLLAFLLSTILS